MRKGPRVKPSKKCFWIVYRQFWLNPHKIRTTHIFHLVHSDLGTALPGKPRAHATVLKPLYLNKKKKACRCIQKQGRKNNR